MNITSIGFVGAGNMATALIRGLVNDGFPASQLWATDVSDHRLTDLEKHCGINTTTDKRVLLSNVDIIVLAVKPQVLKSVCQELASSFDAKNHFAISVAAGIRAQDISAWLGGKAAIVRAMPNTPALIQTGATGLFSNEFVNSDQRNHAEKIMRAVGVVLWVEDENQMDLVTALSGSGPAYFFRMMEVLEKAACEKGLPSDVAHLLTLQTALGAAKLAMESDDTLTALREKVTSPGGTTEKGLAAMEAAGIENMFRQTITAASKRAAELADEFGEK